MDAASPGVTFVSYAQNFEDVALWRAFRGRSSGSYVDIGASADPSASATRALYGAGWSGANLVITESAAAILTADRPIDRTVHAKRGDDQTNAVALREVVRQLIDSVPDLALLRFDATAFDVDTLAALGLNNLRPEVVLIAGYPTTAQFGGDSSVDAFLEAHDYVRTLFDGVNAFFVGSEHVALQKLLSHPVCIFDEPFERASDETEEIRELRRSLEQAKRRVTATEGSQAASQQAISSLTQRVDRLIARATKNDAGISALERRLARHAAIAIEATSNAANWRTQALHDGALISQLRVYTHTIHLERRMSVALVSEAIRHQSDANSELAAIRASTSWKLTLPLRHIRSARSGHADGSVEEQPAFQLEPIDSQARNGPNDDAPTTQGLASGPTFEPVYDRVADLIKALYRRMETVEPLMHDEPTTEGDELARYQCAIEASILVPLKTAWISCVVATGALPDERALHRMDLLLRTAGSSAAIDEIMRLFHLSIEGDRGSTADIEIVNDQVLIDVSHTAANDLHTGIQRVVREASSRWAEHPESLLVRFVQHTSALNRLGDHEVLRFKGWRSEVNRSVEHSTRELQSITESVLVPWNCDFIVPELFAEPERAESYRALASAGIARSFSMLIYDLIPVTAPETVAEGMPGVFANYLATAKYATRVTTISEAVGEEVRGFFSSFESQGLPSPQVHVHVLPPGDPGGHHADQRGSRLIADSEGPMVLVVGSHEPRKNHLTVLASAEQLWRRGARFRLWFIGGSGWRGAEFDAEVARLKSYGRSVRVIKRASEEILWNAYSDARFSIFVSLVEGFGLPIVESLLCLTPVITSDYGSMAEVGAGGGAILVDPRSPGELAAAMSTLLTDDDRLDQLRTEALNRTWKTWDTYAEEVWNVFVQPRSTT